MKTGNVLVGTPMLHVEAELQVPDAFAVSAMDACAVSPNARVRRANRQAKRVNLFMKFSIKLSAEIVS